MMLIIICSNSYPFVKAKNNDHALTGHQRIIANHVAYIVYYSMFHKQASKCLDSTISTNIVCISHADKDVSFFDRT